MFDEMRPAFALRSVEYGAPAPVLAGVEARGRLDAVLFELTVRQTYRNTSERVLEVVYTFPLPLQAVLLGFASELNGRRLEGAIVPRREAEQRYEQALAEGDAPVMLEALGGGLHTANIGNLQPGDEVVLEVRYAQCLAFEQGRLRLSVPTTIAPRYGNAERAAGLQPQQVPGHSLHAEYPLRLTLGVGAALAGAAVVCKTHRLLPAAAPAVAAAPDGRRAGDGGGALYELAPGATLDRDVVVIVTPREPRPSLVVRAADAADAAAPVVLMAALQPAPAAPRERIALKLLVDCSGSMAGDSIASARAALRGVVAGLAPGDRVSLSRFGSTVEHVLGLSELTPATMRRLASRIDAIDADLGGTEMEAALKAVFEVGGDAAKNEAGSLGRDVLLITDGQAWSAEAVVAAARASGHRVFAIGVGAAPAEGVLRPLAEGSGGVCEFATPGEALEAAAARMLGRIRQRAWRNVRVDWGAEPVWQVAPGLNVFGGDTVVAIAGFASAPAVAAAGGGVPAPRLLCDGEAPGGAAHELARGEADAPARGDSIARLAAARRMAGAFAAGDKAAALALALRYQLMSEATNCVLVHERAEGEKAGEAAELHRVPSMLAAGWGGAGTVVCCRAPNGSSVAGSFDCVDLEAAADGVDAFAPGPAPVPTPMQPAFSRTVAAAATPRTASLGSVREPQPVPSPPAPPVDDLARAAGRHFAAGGELPDLAQACAALLAHEALREVLAEVALHGFTRDEACLALAHWANTRSGGLAEAALAAQLQPALAALDAGRLAGAVQVFERLLGPALAPPGTASRAQRLWRAMRGA
ncbi:MAG: VWA domain-containing protein [Rubrivivax sp.]|nr:VWA domain-containing protein [Rubrivivax sp.]